MFEFISLLSTGLSGLPAIVLCAALVTFVSIGLVALAELILEEYQAEVLEVVSASADATWDNWFEDGCEDPAGEAECVEELFWAEMGSEMGSGEMVYQAEERLVAVAMATVDQVYRNLDFQDSGVGPNLIFLGGEGVHPTVDGFWVDAQGRLRDERGRFTSRRTMMEARRKTA